MLAPPYVRKMRGTTVKPALLVVARYSSKIVAPGGSKLRKFAGTLSTCRQVIGEAQSRSPLSTLALWLFIAALVCDAANLDDLLSPGIVLHDDDQIVYSGTDLHDASVASNCTGLRQTDGAFSVRQYSSVRQPFVRVVIDQDSPSLEANVIPASSKVFRFLTDTSAFSIEFLPATGLRHLLFHSLLI